MQALPKSILTGKGKMRMGKEMGIFFAPEMKKIVSLGLLISSVSFKVTGNGPHFRPSRISTAPSLLAAYRVVRLSRSDLFQSDLT